MVLPGAVVGGIVGGFLGGLFGLPTSFVVGGGVIALISRKVEVIEKDNDENKTSKQDPIADFNQKWDFEGFQDISLNFKKTGVISTKGYTGSIDPKNEENVEVKPLIENKSQELSDDKITIETFEVNEIEASDEETDLSTDITDTDSDYGEFHSIIDEDDYY